MRREELKLGWETTDQRWAQQMKNECRLGIRMKLWYTEKWLNRTSESDKDVVGEKETLWQDKMEKGKKREKERNNSLKQCWPKQTLQNFSSSGSGMGRWGSIFFIMCFIILLCATLFLYKKCYINKICCCRHLTCGRLQSERSQFGESESKWMDFSQSKHSLLKRAQTPNI